MTNELYPRFSNAEFDRRYAAARTLMAAHGIDVLVIYGNSGISRHNHADVHYLSGFLGNRNNYLVVPARGEPVLFVQSHNHVPNAREAASVEVVWGGRDSSVTIARHIRDIAELPGTLGYVGDVPVQSYLAWHRELPGWSYKDVSGPYRNLRLVKSGEEIEWLKRGAALTDAAVEHLVENIKPGMHEYELGALVEAAGLARGGLPHLCYMSSAPQEGVGVCVPRQNLSHRIVERGDVVNFEISVSYWGYSGQVQRPLFVQTPPNAQYRALWDCALEAYERCVRVLKAGATSEDVLDAADVIAERGYTINDGFLHGFAIGLMPPSIGTRQSRRGVPKPPFRFEANMCVVVQPNVVTHDERAGVQLGNLFRITETGAECLHRLPVQYYVTG
ncbi:MAG TPA: Xaa-Pro peptidase family protein [Burkholderiales bacterium]|nr:Xaa-Pro peptidase family protein [Burkholderiales bacterium]